MQITRRCFILATYCCGEMKREMDIKAPRGVRDILPDESWKWAYVLNVVAKTMADFGYAEIHLPIFEHTELFSRGV